MIASSAARDEAPAPDEAAPTAVAAAPRWRLTLRTKGALAVAALLLHLALVAALFIVHEGALVRQFDDLGRIHRLQDRINYLGLAATRAAVAAASLRGDAGEAAPDAALVAQVEGLLRSVQEDSDLGVARERARALAAAVERYRASGNDAALVALSRALQDIERELAGADAHVERLEHAREDAFRAQSLTMAVIVPAVGTLGIALIGTVVVLFSTRITTDLAALRRRTAQMIRGERRRPIPITRLDEVGELAVAINELALALDARERELELERRKGFHHEKMAAIASLAAGVLTEIGNPIAAIDGFARALRDDAGAGHSPPGRGTPELDAILEQTARLAAISHEISGITVPETAVRQLVDLNAIVQNAVRLRLYDARARAVGIALELDRQLPAFPGRADRLGHLVANLVGNAIDATRDYRICEPGIRIGTSVEAGTVVLRVVDQGRGMPKEISARAFEPFFSTKPAGRGTGLGLPLCRSIADEHGATIAVDSSFGGGTVVEVRFPHAAPDREESSPSP